MKQKKWQEAGMKNKVYQNVLIGMLTEEKYFLIERYHEEQLGDHSMTSGGQKPNGVQLQ
jgi:hypothetical protein